MAAIPPPRILPRCREALEPPRPALRLVGPPFVIAASRCNRCGACLRLRCGAISDEGGEALVVDPGACSGCARCLPVCRARAIAPVGPAAGAPPSR